MLSPLSKPSPPHQRPLRLALRGCFINEALLQIVWGGWAAPWERGQCLRSPYPWKSAAIDSLMPEKTHLGLGRECYLAKRTAGEIQALCIHQPPSFSPPRFMPGFATPENSVDPGGRRPSSVKPREFIHPIWRTPINKKLCPAPPVKTVRETSRGAEISSFTKNRPCRRALVRRYFSTKLCYPSPRTSVTYVSGPNTPSLGDNPAGLPRIAAASICRNAGSRVDLRVNRPAR